MATPTASPTPSEAASGRGPWLRAGAAALVLALGAFAAAPAVRAGGLEEVVPDSAVFFLSVRSVPELRQKLGALPLYQLYREASVQAFLGEPIERVREVLREVEGEAEGIVSQFVDSCTGEVAIVLLLSEPSFAVGPNFILIATIAGRHEQARVVLDRTLEELRSEGYEERQHEFAGATIIEATRTVTTDLPTERQSDYHCLTDSHLVMGDSLEGMKEVLVGLLREPSAALAAQPDYQAARRALGWDVDLFAYVNLATCVAIWQDSAASGEDDAQALEVFRALGLDEVRAAAAAGAVRRRDLWVAACVFPANEEGLFGVFPGLRGGHECPPWVPADVLSYAWLNLDFGRCWQLANSVLRTLSPPDYMSLRNALIVPGLSGEPILDVERDLIGPLGQGVSAYLRPRTDDGSWISGSGDERDGSAPSALDRWELVQATGLRDGAALSATVERLRVEGFGPFSLLQPVDFQGQRLYTFSSFLHMPFWERAPGEAQPSPEGGTQGEFPALSIFTALPGGDKLITAPRLGILQDVVLRLAASNAAGGPPSRFRRAMARTPIGSATFLVVYNDLQGHTRAVADHVRRHGTLPAWVSFGPLVLLNLLDLQADLFPPDEVILPYLDASLIFGTNDERGLLLEYIILAPPEPTRPETKHAPQPD